MSSANWEQFSDNTSLLHNDTITVTGYYILEFEKSAIYPDVIKGFGKNGVWLNIPNERIDSLTSTPFDWDQSFITVKGVVDTTRHGHLGSYLFELNVFEVSKKIEYH